MAEEDSTESTDVAPVETTEQPQNDDGKGGKDAVLADLAKERSERKRLTREIENLRKQSMTDAEKAVAEAEERGKAAGRSEGNQRVVRSEFAAAAARRNPEFDASKALNFVDVAKFLDESGELDLKALASAVDQLVPEASSPRPRGDVGQGPRQNSKDAVFDGNSFLRTLAGR